jgi:dienelactone hydrolase
MKHVELAQVPMTQVDIPFGDSAIPGYFYKAESIDGKPTPVVIQWNGLDSTKEMMYYSQFPQMLAKRGISTLMVDNPGSGAALRFRGLRSQYNTEEWAKAQIDWLETSGIAGIDTSKIGLVGWSLGGYYAPRAAAFEKRIKQVVAWGANHNWAEVQEGRRQREGENPVPHYWDHVFWVFGASDMDDFKEKTKNMHLNGVVEKINCPFLITHGIGDRQINVKYAHQSYEQAVNSSKLELKVFTEDEGGVEHISIDSMTYAAEFTADWVSETFSEI